MFIRTIDTDGLTTINNPAGYFQVILPINNLVVGSNNLLPVSLLEGQIIEAGCTGTQEGNRYGIIKDLIVNAFLKSNETFIKTSPQYSAKNGNNSYEIIAGPGTYTYSFFPRNNSSTGGAVNAKLIKFSYLSTSGTETVIYEPDSVPDEYGRAEIKGSVSFSTENMRFKMEVKKIGNNYGIVDCLTIKGTIP
jgi:hypothetical protein